MKSTNLGVNSNQAKVLLTHWQLAMTECLYLGEDCSWAYMCTWKNITSPSRLAVASAVPSGENAASMIGCNIRHRHLDVINKSVEKKAKIIICRSLLTAYKLFKQILKMFLWLLCLTAMSNV